MKPADFDYLRAQSIDQAIAWLECHGDAARILAGGQSLLPMMKLRLARPECLIDISGIASLSSIEEDRQAVRLGALVRHCELEGSASVNRRTPMLAHAAGMIGYPQIRHRGTLGGSVCHADPCAELPTVLTALEAQFAVRGRAGRERNIAAGDFFLSYFTTALDDSEILTGVTVPAMSARSGWSFQEFADVDGGLAVACVAVILEIDGEGVCSKARLALGGVAPTPLRIRAAEHMLEGRRIDDLPVEQAVQRVAEMIVPEADQLHSAEHKRALAEALTRRAVNEALLRAPQPE